MFEVTIEARARRVGYSGPQPSIQEFTDTGDTLAEAFRGAYVKVDSNLRFDKVRVKENGVDFKPVTEMPPAVKTIFRRAKTLARERDENVSRSTRDTITLRDGVAGRDPRLTLR